MTEALTKKLNSGEGQDFTALAYGCTFSLREARSHLSVGALTYHPIVEGRRTEFPEAWMTIFLYKQVCHDYLKECRCLFLEALSCVVLVSSLRHVSQVNE